MIGDGIMTVLGLQTKSIQLYAYGVILLSISVSHLIAQDGVPPAVAETQELKLQVLKRELKNLVSLALGKFL